MSSFYILFETQKNNVEHFFFQ